MRFNSTRRGFFGRAAGTLAGAATLSAAGMDNVKKISHCESPDVLPMPAREPLDWQVMTLPGCGLDGRDITITIKRYAAPDLRWAEATFPLTHRHPDGSVSSYRVMLGARPAGITKGGVR